MHEATYQLVIQRRGAADLDDWVALEDRIRQKLGDSAVVDGHDIGAQQANIFVVTRDPLLVYEALRSILDPIPWLRVAYRPRDGDEYTILRPRDLKSFAVS